MPRSVFSKSSFPKLASHISTIFVHGEPILKKKAFSSPRLKKFRRGSGGKGSGDGPRYAADRDATFRRWPSIRRGPGRYPSWGSFRSREASWWSAGRVVRRFFRLIPPSRRLGLSFENKALGHLKASWIILRNSSAQLSQLATKWRGHGIWRGCGRGRVVRPALPSALSWRPPPHFHPAPPTLFLLRRGRVLRPAFAWDRGRVIHLILASPVQAWYSALRV